MRLLRIVVLLSVIPTFAYAQRGGGHGGGGGGFRGGGGGGFRGGGSMGGGGFRGGGFAGGGFRGGGVGGGFGGGFRGGFGRDFGRGFGRGFYGFGLGFGIGWPYWGWPYYGWGWPSYYGGGYPYDYGYSNDYGYPYDYGNGYNYGYTSAQQPAAPVVVQNYSTNPAPAPPATGNTSSSFYRTPDYYLIAFNDHTIRAALSFWVDGDQIRWINREHQEEHAPLSSVDRSFSAQVNRDRHVEFRLPG